MVGLEFILVFPLLGAFLISIIRKKPVVILVAIFSSLTSLILTLIHYISLDRTRKDFQSLISYEWISQWKLNFSLGLDSINAPFVLLSTFITLGVILLASKTVKNKISSFMSLLLLLSVLVNGFFMSTNLLQFFFFYEAMLIPAVLLIQRWGNNKSYQASIKFLIYTFGFSIFLFLAIIAIYYYVGSFSFTSLENLKIDKTQKLLLLFGFILAFFVKIPIVPLHGWLRDAYYESSMPVTIFLSAILGKTGIYGIIRIIPYFNDVLSIVNNWIIFICLVSFIYSAFLALSSKDIKVLFTYMSLSHVGIITAGLFTGNLYGYQGALLQSINHGILSAGLFYVAELLYRHTKSFDSETFGALSKRVPALTFFTFALVMAIGGFPGLNYFNGELLILSGIFKENLIFGFIGVLGVALGVVYLSWFFYRVYLRKPEAEHSLYVKDVVSWEFIFLLSIFLISIYLGLNPDFIVSEVFSGGRQ